jgi:hypothetical protein
MRVETLSYQGFGCDRKKLKMQGKNQKGKGEELAPPSSVALNS